MGKSINIPSANDTLQNNMCGNLHNMSSHCSTEEEATVVYEVDTIDLCSVTEEYAIVHTQEDIEPQASTSTSTPTPSTSHVKKCRKRQGDAYDGLVEAETPKVHLEQKKLKLQCSVLEQELVIGKFKIEVLK